MTEEKRTRRSEPITKRTAKNGAVSYEFRADLGVKADGTRDRRRFTYRTLAEARKEYRRITTEVASGTYSKPTTITVDEACAAWLAGRRGIRAVTLRGYTNDLKPVRRFLGGKKLQQLTKDDGDALVSWMLTEGRQSVSHLQPESLAGQIVALVGRHPDGITSSEISAAFPGQDTATRLSDLAKRGQITRLRRAVYGPASQATEETREPAGVKPVTVRATLTAFTMVVKSYVDQGVLPRNVVALVERPADAIEESDDAARTAKSWTLAEAEAFRAAVADHRLFACWLLSIYGMRRSEVLGLKWSAIDGDVLRVRRGRVALDAGVTDEGLPKSRRSWRDLPLPADVVAALGALKRRQRAEALALGVPWDEDRLVATREDGTPVPPEWWTDEFHRIRERAGLRRIQLKGLRNTSVSLMLDRGHPVHVVAAWHGHDPSMSLSIYADAKADELRAAGGSLFG